MRLIGINGFKRSGKGETGEAIDLARPGPDLHVYRCGFADKLKILGAKALGFDRSDAELIALMDSMKDTALMRVEYIDPDTALWTVHQTTGRQYMQDIGKRFRDALGKDFWVGQVLPAPAAHHNPDLFRAVGNAQLRGMYPGVDVLVFTDLRYENEAERILALGGEVWEVIRPGQESDGHESEQVLPRHLVTKQINNDGDLATLRQRVVYALADSR